MKEPSRSSVARHLWVIVVPFILALASCSSSNDAPAENEVNAAADVPAESSYPTKPITLIVPFPPGGSTYFTADVVAEELRSAFGQEVVLEVTPGNYGFNSIERMLEDTDGHTLLVGNVLINSTSPVFHPEALSFDYAKEVIPVTRLADFPFVVMTNLSMPGESLGDLLEHLKSTSGTLTYGTDFPGTPGDIYMLELAKSAGLDLQYVEISGANAIFEDLVTGKTDIAILNVATATRNKGKYKALAVTGSRELPNFPGVPMLGSVSEADIGVGLWQGLFAPRGTPEAVVSLLHATLVERMARPEVVAKFEEINAESATSESAAEFQASIDREVNLWETSKEEVLAIPAVKAPE